MKFYFIFCILIFYSTFAESKVLIKKPDTLKHAGYIFDHYEIQDYCLKKELCEKEGPNVCLSTKAKFLRCSEQYKENWIVTCVCQ